MNLIDSDENHGVDVFEYKGKLFINNYGNVSTSPKIPSLDKLNKIQKNVFKEQIFQPPIITNLNTIPFLDLDVIIQHLTNKTLEQKLDNKMAWLSKVAESEDIAEDIHSTGFPIISKPLYDNLLVRSIVGHAANGHSWFGNEFGPGKMPNTTNENIVSNEVFNLLQEYTSATPKYSNSSEYFNETQGFIDDIVNVLERAVNSYKKTITLNDEKKDAFLGIDLFNDIEIDPQALLKGFYYGAQFDSYEDIRKIAEEKYDLRYGGGEEYLLNKDKVINTGINLKEFSTQNYLDNMLLAQPHKKRIKLFEKMGILLANEEINFEKFDSWSSLLEKHGRDMTSKEYAGFFRQYLRTKKGKGGSDDTLIRLAAFIDFDEQYKSRGSAWYNGLQIGAQLADLIDTLEKATAYFVPGGQDVAIAKYIEQKWLKKARANKTYRQIHKIKTESLVNNEYALVNKEQIIMLTALGINPKEEIHSSARYFLKVQNPDKHPTSTIEQEFIYMQNKLSELGIDMTQSGEKVFSGTQCENTDVLIGFRKQPFKSFINHMDNDVFPIAKMIYSKPEPLRDKLISEIYRNS